MDVRSSPRCSSPLLLPAFAATPPRTKAVTPTPFRPKTPLYPLQSAGPAASWIANNCVTSQYQAGMQSCNLDHANPIMQPLNMAPAIVEARAGYSGFKSAPHPNHLLENSRLLPADLSFANHNFHPASSQLMPSPRQQQYPSLQAPHAVPPPPPYHHHSVLSSSGSLPMSASLTQSLLLAQPPVATYPGSYVTLLENTHPLGPNPAPRYLPPPPSYASFPPAPIHHHIPSPLVHSQAQSVHSNVYATTVSEPFTANGSKEATMKYHSNPNVLATKELNVPVETGESAVLPSAKRNGDNSAQPAVSLPKCSKRSKRKLECIAENSLDTRPQKQGSQPWSDHLLEEIGLAFEQMLKYESLQGHWYTANIVATMLKNLTEFEGKLAFDERTMNLAIRRRFLLIDVDSKLNQSGAFRFTKKIVHAHHCNSNEAVDTTFYFICRPGQPIDWQQTPEVTKGTQTKSWHAFYESCNRLPSDFIKTLKKSKDDEVDCRLKAISESLVREEENKTHENTKIDEENAAPNLTVKSAIDGQDGKEIFNPPKEETVLQTLKRRIDILRCAFNEIDGYKLILSEDDNKKHDYMIESESKETRSEIYNLVFAIRQKATCLLLAYTQAVNEFERDNTVAWDSICHNVSVQLGLASPHEEQMIVCCNIEFREKEVFSLEAQNPKSP